MVSVLRLGATACALLLAASCAAAAGTPARRYELSRTALALGEPLLLRLTRELGAAGTPLDALDLQPLARDFEILEHTLGRDDRQEHLALTLYPRRLGRIQLPALGQPGRAPVVTVSESSDTLAPVRLRVSVEPAEPLVRQPVALTLEACDDGTLRWQRPVLPAMEGLLLRPLHETEIITTRDGQRCTAHRWHWSLLPTAAGRTALQLPVLEAGKFGTRLRFAPPPFELKSAPLPGWLPPEAAVGEAVIEAEPLPAQAVRGQPLAWRLKVSGSYSSAALQSLLALQLRAAEGEAALTPYAPRVEPEPGLELLPQHRVTLYLLPSERGSFTVPALQLPWFDPASGRLQHARLAGATIEVIDPVRQRWLIGLAAAASLLALLPLARWLWRRHAWRLRRRRVMRALRSVQSTPQLIRVLAMFGATATPLQGPTLQSWRAHVEANFSSTGLSELVAALDRNCFGPASAADPAPLPDDLLRQARRWLASVRGR
ncbi:MAG: hypothetical protein OEW36_08680 [Hylemonella sp.]|nr:hypothetical protein [Hylemonella sp.]